jgi:hypothetical protein
MKTKMKRQGSTEFPRFAVGALAIAGASAANGATVQITFDNNLVSLSSGATNFVGDLTGDLLTDLSFISQAGPGYVKLLVASVATYGYARRNSVVSLGRVNMGPGSSRALVPFSFRDAAINSNGVTSGFLDVEGFAGSVAASLQIHRLIFDDASTTAPTGLTSASTGIPEWSAVPEPSSFALLALGAGGLIARRRRQAA